MIAEAIQKGESTEENEVQNKVGTKKEIHVLRSKMEEQDLERGVKNKQKHHQRVANNIT